MTDQIIIRKRIKSRDVWWEGVHETLKSRFSIPPDQAGNSVKIFRARIASPVSLYWYRHPQLPVADNQIVAAICECHGADSISITTEKSWDIPLCHVAYHQTIEFEPCFRKGDNQPGKGTCRPVLEFHVGKRVLHFQGLPASLAVQLALLILAAISYAIVAGLFLYSLAVFITFLRDPVPVSMAATRHSHIGLALLCLLVGLAAISGKAIREAILLLKTKLRPRRASLENPASKERNGKSL